MTDRSDCAPSCPLAQAAGPSRRDFVSTALTLSVGAFLVACGDGLEGGSTGLGNALTVTLANFPALAADGGIARVDGGSATAIAVTRVNATSYRAFSMACTHEGQRVNISGSGFACPAHGATFSATGAVTRGPAAASLREYQVVLNAAAGTLTIS